MKCPAILVASDGFEDDIDATAAAFALPGLQYVVVERPYTNLTAEQSRAQTDPVIDELITLLTTQPREAGTEPGERQRMSTLDISVVDGESWHEAVDEFLLERDCTDGYPVRPPTRDRVDGLLDAIDADPDEVICLLPPGNGEATLARVVVNCAMAGCRPAEVPIVTAALRAIANHHRTTTRVALMSTSAHAPLVLVNGPIAARAGVNGGRGCLGPGKQNAANIRISRAIGLCLRNLGKWRHGVMDLDSIGTPRKNIVVLAENEAESPWEPHHVRQGFDPTDSVVTVFFTGGEWDLSIQGHTDSQQLAKAIASHCTGNWSVGYLDTVFGGLTEEEKRSPLGRLLLLCPDHARPLADDGFGKLSLETFLWHNTHESVSRMIEPLRKVYSDGNIKAEYRWLFGLTPEQADRMTLPVIEYRENYTVLVAGAFRAKDMFMPTRSQPRSEPVRERVRVVDES